MDGTTLSPPPGTASRSASVEDEVDAHPASLLADLIGSGAIPSLDALGLSLDAIKEDSEAGSPHSSGRSERLSAAALSYPPTDTESENEPEPESESETSSSQGPSVALDDSFAEESDGEDLALHPDLQGAMVLSLPPPPATKSKGPAAPARDEPPPAPASPVPPPPERTQADLEVEPPAASASPVPSTNGKPVPATHDFATSTGVLAPACFATRDRPTTFERLSFKISTDWTHLDLISDDGSTTEDEQESEAEDGPQEGGGDGDRPGVTELRRRAVELRTTLERRQAKAARRRRRLLTELGCFLDPSAPSIAGMGELWRRAIHAQARNAAVSQDLTEASIDMLSKLNPNRKLPTTITGLKAMSVRRRQRVATLRRELRAHVLRCAHNLRVAQLRAVDVHEGPGPDAAAAAAATTTRFADTEAKNERDRHLRSASLVFSYHDKLRTKWRMAHATRCRVRRVAGIVTAELAQLERSLLEACARDSLRVIAKSQFILKMHQALEDRKRIKADEIGESKLGRAAKVQQRQHWCSALRQLVHDFAEGYWKHKLDERQQVLDDQERSLAANVAVSIARTDHTTHEAVAKAAKQLWRSIAKQQQGASGCRQRALRMRVRATSCRMSKLFGAARHQAQAWPEAVKGQDLDGPSFSDASLSGAQCAHEAGRRAQAAVFTLWNEFGVDQSEQLGFLQHALSLSLPQTPEGAELLRAEAARLQECFAAVQLLGDCHAIVTLQDAFEDAVAASRSGTEHEHLNHPATEVASSCLDNTLDAIHLAEIRTRLGLLDVISRHDGAIQTLAELRPAEHKHLPHADHWAPWF